MVTLHANLRAVLARLVQGSQSIFGANFVGAYLHGSLAGGDFNPETSDVDFVVLLDSPVADEALPQLEELYAELSAIDAAWARRLEGSFMPWAAFRQVGEQGAYPSYDEGQFLIDHKGINNAMQRHILRERGITLAGPEPHTFIDAVSPEELKQESLWLLHYWWKPQLTEQRYLRERVYQAYGVLTMCRISYTLATGNVATKPRAAEWMKQSQPEWAALIDRALVWSKDTGVDDLADTLRMITAVANAHPE